MNIICYKVNRIMYLHTIWRPPSLSELTPYLIQLGLTHLGSEASIYIIEYSNLNFFHFLIHISFLM